MRFQASTTVPLARPLVWAFIADPMTSPSWDTSIAEVVPVAPGPVSVGWEAETVSPLGKRQRFRVTELVPDRALAFELLGDPKFISAVLRFELASVEPGATHITHTVEMRARNRLTSPVLAAAGGRALARDLTRLRVALIEADGARGT